MKIYLILYYSILREVIKKMTRPEILRQKLEALIGNMQPGEKLPPVRNLLRQYEVSISTFQQAVEPLRSSGKLKIIQGGGIYVGGAVPKKRPRIRCVDILFFGEKSSLQKPGYSRDLLQSLVVAFGDNGISTKTTVVSPFCSCMDLISQIRELELKSVITLSLRDAGLIYYLKSRKIPYVCITPEMNCIMNNSVYINEREVAFTAVEQFFLCGHRKFAYLHVQQPGFLIPGWMQRDIAYYEACARYGVIPNPDLIQFMGYSAVSGETATNQLLDTEIQFTALLAHECGIAGVYHALQSRGIRIGQDISVIGIDHLDTSQEMYPGLASVEISRVKLALEAKKMLEKELECGELEIEPLKVSPAFIHGPSLGKITPA